MQEITTQQEAGIEAVEFLRETLDLVKRIETNFLELGGRLYEIREKNVWRASYEAWDDFLVASRLSKSTASKLISVFEAYVVEGGVSQETLEGVPYSLLYEAIPLIENHGVPMTVAKVKLLTRSEIKEEVREEKHGDCQHTETIHICAACHKRV